MSANRPREACKVIRLNRQLALMITGHYSTDSMAAIEKFAARTGKVLTLNRAFDDLMSMGSGLQLAAWETFKVGLAGYSRGKPTFRFVCRTPNDPEIDSVRDYPLTYYLSGAKKVVHRAEKLVAEAGLVEVWPTPEIQTRVRHTLSRCLKENPDWHYSQFTTLSRHTSRLVASTALYFLYERAWGGISWGRRSARRGR